MQLKTATAILLLMATVQGCASKGIALEHLQTSIGTLDGARLCGSVSNLDIEDARDSVSERSLQIPRITTGRQRDRVHPALSDELTEVIRSEVMSRITGGSAEYRVRVRVLHGVQQFRARKLAEEEGARWVTEVALQGANTNTSASAEVEYFVSSLDASQSFSDTLARRVLQLSVAEAFRRAAAPIAAVTNGSCSDPASSRTARLFERASTAEPVLAAGARPSILPAADAGTARRPRKRSPGL